MEEWEWLVRSLGLKYGFPTSSSTGDDHHVVLPGSNQDSRLECLVYGQAEESTAPGTSHVHHEELLNESASPVSVLPHDVLQSASTSSSYSSSSVQAQIVNAPPPPPPRRQCHEEVNKLLVQSGLPCVRLHDEEQLYDTMLLLLRDCSKREALVEELQQDLLQEVQELRKSEKQSNEQSCKLEAEVELSRRKLALLQQRHTMALSTAEATNATLRKDVHSLEASNLNLQQRCSQLEHNCRAKERAAERYQNKLLDFLVKEEGQRSRSSTGKNLQPAASHILVDKQKAALMSEVRALRARVAELCHELQKGEGLDHSRSSLVHHQAQHLLEQQLCNKLGVKRPSQLLVSLKKQLLPASNLLVFQAAVDDVLIVNAAVPLLEQFVEDVCNVVLVSGREYLPMDAALDPTEVPHVLKNWLKLLSGSE